MSQSEHIIDVLDARAQRRDSRRAFFTNAFSAAAIGAAGAGFIYANAAAAQTAPSDADVLNFALNLEYLEANFYYFAVFGNPIPASSTDGPNGAGVVATGGAKVTFNDPLVEAYAREIAADELNHVNFLRGALMSGRVAQPAIDLSNTPFRAAAAAAGIPNADQFDAYADDNSFLLASYIFEDVGVTAYKGAAPLITNPTFLEAAAGILAVEAYHAAIIRTTLYAKGIETPALFDATTGISNARDLLDGSPTLDEIRGIGPDDDQGIAPTGTGDTTTSNIVPLNANGLAYSRSTGQVLNIVYLTANQATMGGFFPQGVNGAIRTSGGSVAA